MTTEDKIKKAFEAQYGSRNEWRDMRTYDSAWEDFRSGYMTCLNSLEPTNLICNTHMLYRLPKGVTKLADDAKHVM
jgi:hypothetical protein